MFSSSDKMYTMLITKFDKSDRGSILFDDFIQCCVVLQVMYTKELTPVSQSKAVCINHDFHLYSVLESVIDCAVRVHADGRYCVKL